MINLIRTKKHKWIFQKNISSVNIINAFIKATEKNNHTAQKDALLASLKRSGIYQGRSDSGNPGTMGVRTSEMKFYMFGYSLNSQPSSAFFLSPMSRVMLYRPKAKLSEVALINLFSIQFPHPFSNTQSEFKINAGRLITALLLEEKIGSKLYIDEFCYFVPFIETINQDTYNELIQSIIEFRKLGFEEKENLFKSVPNYDEVFSNVFHEVNYYFLRIFRDLKVLNIIPDEKHNSGKVLKFVHGNDSAIRTDAYGSRKNISGYVELNPDVLCAATILSQSYSFLEKPLEQNDNDTMSRDDFIRELYELRPLRYLAAIERSFERNNEVAECLKIMVHFSKYGSRDGLEFENALKPVFELFEEVQNVEHIGGGGDTDLVCTLKKPNNDVYKINVDGKTSKKGTSSLLVTRLTEHLELQNSKYCIVVSSRFAIGASRDLRNSMVVALKAETLANYCLNEFGESTTGWINFSKLENIILNNLGKDITNEVDVFINTNYGSIIH